MGKVLIAVGAIATLAVGTLAADQATSQEYRPSYKSWWMVGHADDTTPCRETPRTGWSGGSHTDLFLHSPKLVGRSGAAHTVQTLSRTAIAVQVRHQPAEAAGGNLLALSAGAPFWRLLHPPGP